MRIPDIERRCLSGFGLRSFLITIALITMMMASLHPIAEGVGFEGDLRRFAVGGAGTFFVQVILFTETQRLLRVLRSHSPEQYRQAVSGLLPPSFFIYIPRRRRVAYVQPHDSSSIKGAKTRLHLTTLLAGFEWLVAVVIWPTVW